MNAIIKLLIGAILMILSVWWIFQGSEMSIGQLSIQNKGIADLVILLNGGIPVGIFIIGLFIVWLELDEIRIEKEIRSEEKPKKRK